MPKTRFRTFQIELTFEDGDRVINHPLVEFKTPRLKNANKELEVAMVEARSLLQSTDANNAFIFDALGEFCYGHISDTAFIESGKEAIEWKYGEKIPARS